MYADRDHIKGWIRQGRAILLPVDVSRRLEKHLDGLSWSPAGTGLDWGRITNVRIDLTDSPARQLSSWRSASLRDDTWLVFLYSPKEPCMEFALSHFDEAFWAAPGRRFVFGALVTNGVVLPVLDHFAEFDGVETVRATALPAGTS